MNSKLLIASAVFLCTSATAQMEMHKMVTPASLVWSDLPSLPPGAKISVIEGPMNEAVPFVARIKLPANYKIPPHWHPVTERVTVLSGTFYMGLGEKFDMDSSSAVETGSMMLMQPKQAHFGWTKEGATIQLHGTGPWGITYINPMDDPRKK